MQTVLEIIWEPQESVLAIDIDDANLTYGYLYFNDCEDLYNKNVITKPTIVLGQKVEFICSTYGSIKTIQVININGDKIKIDKINWPQELEIFANSSLTSKNELANNSYFEQLSTYLENAYIKLVKLAENTLSSENKLLSEELSKDKLFSEDELQSKDIYKLYINQKGFGGMKRSLPPQSKPSQDDPDNSNTVDLTTQPDQSDNLSEKNTDEASNKVSKVQTPYFSPPFASTSSSHSSSSIITDKIKKYLDEDPEVLEQALIEIKKVRNVPEHGVKLDIKAISSIRVVPSIFQVISNATGVKCVMVGRIMDGKWIACAVADNPSFPMKPGDELELEPTICNDIWKYHKPIAIDDVAKDPIYRNHCAPKMYNFQSYISVPLIRKNGCFFGTLCAIDPAPAKVNTSEIISMFCLFADLISYHLQAIDEIDASKKANQAKTNLVSHVSHEIRTPLSGILGFLELALREKDCSATIREFLNYAYNSTLSLKTIADDILDIIKMETEIFKLETIPFSPKLVAEEVLTSFKVAADKKEIALKLKETNRVPQALIGDPLRFKQILLNLVGNSLKFTQHGSIKVKLDGIADIKQPSSFRFKGTIKDTGIGMDTQTCERLFNPFMQADESTARKFGGTGLGLSITKQLCEKMGGNIKVSSELGLGSRFEFILRLGSTAS